MSHWKASWANAKRLSIRRNALLSTDDAGLRGIVAREGLQLTTEGSSLKSVEHRLNRGQPQRFAVKHKVVLLAAQRYEIETERLSGRFRRNTTVRLAGQHSMRCGQMAECDRRVSI